MSIWTNLWILGDHLTATAWLPAAFAPAVVAIAADPTSPARDRPQPPAPRCHAGSPRVPPIQARLR